MATDENKIATVNDDFLLDDIEDMPGFVVFPSGAYHVRLDKGIEKKEINDKNFYDIPMTVVEVAEISEKLAEHESPPKIGDIGNLLFARENKFGMGSFKSFVKPIAEKFNCKTVGELLDNSKGLELLIVVKRRYNKDKDSYNMNAVKSVVI